jgi:hypothetical protein
MLVVIAKVVVPESGRCQQMVEHDHGSRPDNSADRSRGGAAERARACSFR